MTARAGIAPRRPRAGSLWGIGAGIAAFVAILAASMGGEGVTAIPTTVAKLVIPAGTGQGQLSGERASQIARRISVVHADTQAVWGQIFRIRLGRRYAAPELVLFSRNTPTPCADAFGATGPFYCQFNRYTAFDLVFFDAISAGMAARGDLALALIVAQIAGSHVQAELSILGDVERLRPRQTPEERRATELAVALQADCLAGVWARRAEARIGPVPPGAFGEAVAEARQVAQELQTRGHTAPSSYNAYHLGRIADRNAAFAAGYAAGELRDCLSAGLSGDLY